MQPSDPHQPVISGSGQFDGAANLRLTIVQEEIVPPTSQAHEQTGVIQLIQEHSDAQVQTHQQGQTLEPELDNDLDHALDQAPDEAPIRTPTDTQVLANIQTQAHIKKLANGRRKELTSSGYMMVTPLTKSPTQPITGADRNPTYPDGGYVSMHAIQQDQRQLEQRRGPHGEIKGTNLYPVLQTNEPFDTYIKPNGPRHVEEPNSSELQRNDTYQYAVPSQDRRPLDEPSSPVYDHPMLPARSIPTPSKFISETWEEDGITYINGNIKPQPRVLPQQEKKEIVYY